MYDWTFLWLISAVAYPPPQQDDDPEPAARTGAGPDADPLSDREVRAAFRQIVQREWHPPASRRMRLRRWLYEW